MQVGKYSIHQYISGITIIPSTSHKAGNPTSLTSQYYCYNECWPVLLLVYGVVVYGALCGCVIVYQRRVLVGDIQAVPAHCAATTHHHMQHGRGRAVQTIILHLHDTRNKLFTTTTLIILDYDATIYHKFPYIIHIFHTYIQWNLKVCITHGYKRPPTLLH